MSKYLQNGRQEGRSMVEMLGVLAIIGVLSIGGISGYSSAMGKFKMTQIQDQLMTLLNNIRTVYATEPDYSGLNLSVLKAMNMIPKDMTSGKHAFGGDIAIGNVDNPAGAVPTGEKSFAIEFGALPAEVCARLAASEFAGDPTNGLIKVTIGTTEYSWEGSNKLPIALGTAQTSCSSGGADQNDLTWSFY